MASPKRIRNLPPLDAKGSNASEATSPRKTLPRKMPPLDDVRELMIGSPVPKSSRDTPQPMTIDPVCLSPRQPCPAIKISSSEKLDNTDQEDCFNFEAAPRTRCYSDASHLSTSRARLLTLKNVDSHLLGERSLKIKSPMDQQQQHSNNTLRNPLEQIKASSLESINGGGTLNYHKLARLEPLSHPPKIKLSHSLSDGQQYINTEQEHQRVVGKNTMKDSDHSSDNDDMSEDEESNDNRI